MVAELRILADALGTISGISVLRTRWYAEKINASLPACIVDYSRPLEPLLTESGHELASGEFFYLELAVKPDFVNDPLEALERLEAILIQAKDAIRAAFPMHTVQFIQPEVIEMPFGKQSALSFICDLYIG